MLRKIFTLLFVLFSCSGFAQNASYVKGVTMLTSTDSLTEFNYVDGMGRPVEKVSVGITPQHTNLVSYKEYDMMGREVKNWLPFASSSNFVQFPSIPNGCVKQYNDSAPMCQVVMKNPLWSVVSRLMGQAQSGVHPRLLLVWSICLIWKMRSCVLPYLNLLKKLL